MKQTELPEHKVNPTYRLDRAADNPEEVRSVLGSERGRPGVPVPPERDFSYMRTGQDYDQESDSVVEAFLERTFFKAWRGNDRTSNYYSNELIVNSRCDLKCDYCYYTHHGEQLCPAEISQDDRVIHNLELWLSYLDEKGFTPKLDLFSGELLSQPVGYTLIDRCIDWMSSLPKERRSSIVLPTNFNFMFDSGRVAMVERFIERCHSAGIRFGLSASLDGPYMEANRPFRDLSRSRDPEFYHRVFSFCSRHGFHFHPMIYYEGIEHWKENFEWFQDMFRSYGMEHDSKYLLEVRNAGWTPETAHQLEKFFNYVVHFIWDLVGHDPDEFVKVALRGSYMNVLSQYCTIGRGLPCSIQGTLSLRLGDLSVNPCHRLAYPEFKSFDFAVSDDRITGVRARNWELYLTVATTSVRNLPYCQDCFLKSMCAGGCLGAQYEATGDLFVPDQSVCLVHHAKFRGITEALIDIGVLPAVLKQIHPDKVSTVAKYLHFRDRLSLPESSLNYL